MGGFGLLAKPSRSQNFCGVKVKLRFEFFTASLALFILFKSWPAALVVLIGACFDALRIVLEHKPDPELEQTKKRLEQVEEKLRQHSTVVDALTLSNRMPKL